jgi:hypothetical protein
MMIYYRADDGEIFGWTTAAIAEAPAGLLLAEIDPPEQPDPSTQKYDAASGQVVPKTAAEQQAALPRFQLTPIQ